jgi:hypothetical protein
MDTLARKLERCSRVKENVAFYSKKTKSFQYCESRTEADAALIREFAPCIKEYVTQPTSIFYKRNGKLLRYTPDALIKTVDNKIYFEEVKYFSDLEKDEIKEKYEFLSSHFKQNIGIPLFTNTALSNSNCLTITNLEILYPYLATPHTKQHKQQCLELVHSLPAETCIAEMSEKSKKLNFPVNLAWQVLANGFYTYSNNELISSNSNLELTINE